jgi:hypothetical protein
MNNKNLIIALVGDGSLHKEWIGENQTFDLILIYYGRNEEIFSDYTKDAFMCIRQTGQKFPLIKSFIDKNPKLISGYEYIWLPDDDISISTHNLNKLFNIAREYNLQICQPAIISAHGKIAHDITKPQKGCKLRYTNFVEVMMPLFDVKTLLFLRNDFDLSQSGWGLDASWSHRMNYPKNKIAIIDDIMALHTKPLGADYSRFSIKPRTELNNLLQKYNISFQIKNYSSILMDNSNNINWFRKIFKFLS